MRFVRTFNLFSIAVFSFLASQPDPVIFRSINGEVVGGSLDSLINEDPDLTVMLDLHRIIVSDKIIEYKKL